MNQYQYEAWDTEGNRRTGLKEAGNQEEILGWLREESYTPVSVDVVADAAPRKKKRTTVCYKKVKSTKMAGLCWQLGTMLEGGITITTAMETIAEDLETLYLQDVLSQIATKIQQGETLSSCVEQYPKIFNTISRAMTSAGEVSGTIVTTLYKLARYYEDKDKLVGKVKSAIAYPIFVVVFINIIVAALMFFIIPRFRGIFEDMGSELPGFTKAFLAFYDGIVANLVPIFGTIILAVVGIWGFSKTKKGYRSLSAFVLKIPLFGKVLSQAFIAMFFKALATLLDAGVPILDIFEIISRMTNNYVIKKAIVTTRQCIVEGSSISTSMIISGFFPNVAVKMTQVGEDSGKLPEVMDKTSEYYERRVDIILGRMLGLLEPILIVAVAAIVLVVVLAMYLPVFYISDIQGS